MKMGLQSILARSHALRGNPYINCYSNIGLSPLLSANLNFGYHHKMMDLEWLVVYIVVCIPTRESTNEARDAFLNRFGVSGYIRAVSFHMPDG